MHPELSAGSAEECPVLTSITFQCGKDIDLLLCVRAAFCLDLCRVKEKINWLFSHRASPGSGFSPPGDRLLLLEGAEGGPLRLCRTVPEDGLYQAAVSPTPEESCQWSSSTAQLSAGCSVPGTRLQGLAFYTCVRCHAQLPSAGLGDVATDLKEAGPSLDY